MQGYNPNWSGLLSSGAMMANALQGVGGAFGQQVSDRRQQQAQSGRQRQMMADVSAALESNDPNMIAMTSIQYPEAQKALETSLNFRNDQTKRQFVETNLGILADPENAGDLLRSRAEYLESIGADPTETLGRLRMYESDPDRFIKMTEAVTAGVAPNEYKAWQSSRPEKMTEFQAQDIDIKRENTKLRAMEADMRRDQQRLASESNELKRQELEAKVEEKRLKVDEQKQKLESAEKVKESGRANAIEAANLAEQLLNDPGLSSITGTVQARLPTISGESQDLINKANRLQSLLTVDNLKLMTGVLTDRDIAFLTNVASGLNVTEGGILGSEQGVKDRLQQIVSKIRKNVKGDQAVGQDGKGNAPQSAIDYLMANPGLKEQFKAKYGYLPEGM